MAKTEKTKKPFYKKWWVWVIAIIVIFAVSGGDEEQPASTDVKDTEKSATTETKKNEPKKEEKAKEEVKTAGIGEEVKVGDVSFTVHGTETTKKIGDQYVSQEAQGTYLIVDVTVKNNAKEAITTDSSFFKLKSDGAEYEADGTADLYINDASKMFFLQKINPGNASRGKIAFDVNDTVINAKDTLLNVQTGFWGSEQGEIKIAK
jgi:hypothetical protein